MLVVAFVPRVDAEASSGGMMDNETLAITLKALPVSKM
jgi:hypothetical protein